MHPDFARQGIATQLFQTCLLQLPTDQTNLYSITAFAPALNIPSFLVHQKFGFRPIAISLPTNMFGFEDYQSLLWKREI